MTENTPIEAEFRACGMTANAINWPLSERGYQWLLKFNGVPEGYAVPRAWRYAPNKACQRRCDRMAEEAGM